MPLLLAGALPAVAAETAPAQHVVRKGDTLSAISRSTGVPLEDLMRYNGLAIDSLIHAGRSIALTGAPAAPVAPGTVKVAAGEGWLSVARRSGLAVGELRTLNGLTDGALLYPGMVLRTEPTAAPAPAAPAATPAATYTVVVGDSWWTVAQATGVDAQALQTLNGMNASTLLHAGTVLALPGAAGVRQSLPVEPVAAVEPAPETPPTAPVGPAVHYTVQPGDSPWSISMRFEVSIPRLRELNGMTRHSPLPIGQVLLISDGTPEVAETPTGPVGDTFLDRTFPWHMVSSANENLRLLQSMPAPTAAELQSMIRETAEDMGVDPSLALAHAYVESAFNHVQVAPANAIGVMQVIPVAGEFASDLVGRELNLLDPKDNVTAGVALIRHFQSQTASEDLGIGAYLRGLGGITRDGIQGYTLTYVARVNAARAMF